MSDWTADPIQNLPSWTRPHGISLSPSQLELLRIFLNQLLIWNQRMNLTGISSPERVLRELILDSLIPLPFFPDSGQFLDVGSGAGFPAIPLKICRPNLGAHLLEANGKKVNFLKQVVRLTRVAPVRIDQGRIERDNHLLQEGGYDVITARGVAKLSRIIQWCAPHLGEKGVLFNFQGSRYRDALVSSSSVLHASGLALHRTVPYNLPGMESPRHLLIIGRIESGSSRKYQAPTHWDPGSPPPGVQSGSPPYRPGTHSSQAV